MMNQPDLSHAARLPRCVFVFLMSLLLAALAVAADEPKSFDIREGDAAQTLKQFSAQSGVQLVFPTDLVQGVRTHEVRGRYIPVEALEKMLGGTVLIVVRDEKPGAFAIRRSDNPSARRSSPAQPGNSPWGRVGEARLGAAPSEAALGGPQESGTGAITGRVQNVVTGQYLNNARVSVKGTDLVAFTDQSGTYHLPRVSAGTAVLEIFYTGLDPQQISVQVLADQSVERHVELTSIARYGRSEDTVRLASYVVSTSREVDAEAIATNEQRFAANIKNVVAADAFGDVVEGNVGEFMKFLPGVVVEYEAAQVNRVSVRGLPTDTTAVTSDGMTIATSTANSRAFEFKDVAMSSISRIELTKVPTPATRADALAGSVNMVSKTAFERKTAELRYRVLLSGNNDSLSLKKYPDSKLDRKQYRVLPGIDLHYIMPVSTSFGFALSASSISQFNEQNNLTQTHSAGGTSTGASAAAPYLSSIAVIDGPRLVRRHSLHAKMDWKIGRFSVISVAGQAGIYEAANGTNSFSLSVGANGTPTVTGGQSLTYGPDWVHGATGRGGVTLGGGAHIISIRASNMGNVQYRYNDGTHALEAGASLSTSRQWTTNEKEGTFQTLNISLRDPVRVELDGIRYGRVPQSIRVIDGNNQEVDIFDIENYRLVGATNARVDRREEVSSGYINLSRQINLLSIPSTIQIGAAERRLQRDHYGSGTLNWTYGGVDGNAATVETPRPYLAQVYANQNPGYRLSKSPPWVAPSRVWDAFQANPILFHKTPAQLVSDEVNRIVGSVYLKEIVSAYYAQIESRFLRNRFRLLTGVRYEKTTNEGLGPVNDPSAVWVRNPDGTFARNAAGQRIRKPEAGAVGSMEELRLTRQERGQKAAGGYDGYYPSVHLTYHIRENFLARAAYAKTYGRPNLLEIIPTTTVDEFDVDDDDLEDPEVVRGSLTLRNPGLRPWTADNYDLSIEYYTESGGIFSAGIFLKEIKDFFGQRIWFATAADIEELGLDPRYIGWRITTNFNSGDARVTGAEFSIRQSLGRLGEWGKYWTVFVNGTKLKLEGHQQASFTSFIPESFNWGITFRRNKLMFMVKQNYQGDRRTAAYPTLGPDASSYERAFTTFDFNVEYQLYRSAGLFASVSNILNAKQGVVDYGSETPDYAKRRGIRDHGAQINIGIKGTF